MDLPAWGSLPIEKIDAGSYRIVMSYGDGKVEEKTVEIGRSDAVKLEFNYRPAPLPEPAPEKPVRPSSELRFNTIGAMVGSSFSVPWLIGTLHGTWAPWSYSFFELGMDVGTISGEADVTHFSLYPFIRYNFFLPIGEGGWYAGAGAGYMRSAYTYPEGKLVQSIIAADITTGYFFGFGLNVSYSFRTDFSSASNKLAVGYSYRFK